MAYALSNDIFLLLKDAFNQDRAKARVFAKVIAGPIRTYSGITPKKETGRTDDEIENTQLC